VCWQAYWTLKAPQLSNGKHRDQCVSTMKTYVLPHIGQHPIGEIKPGEIMDLLKSIWHTKDETVRRVLQRTDSVFLSATTRDLRQGQPLHRGLATVATVKSITRHFHMAKWRRSSES
jgi:hypothetical protein